MTKYISILLLALASFVFVSCSSTPASRIERNPEVFASLTNQQKQAVLQGRIEKGMPPGGVFLAWGHPSSVAEGVLNGTPSLRWIYTSLQPVLTPTWGMGYWGPWGPYGRGFYGGGLYDDITYIPVDCGYVLFKNNVVDSWEMRDPR